MMPNRYICQVLEEMRACYKTYNFGAIAGLIEEAQSMANRMEAALEDQRDFDRYREQCKDLRKERDKLGDEVDKLREEKEKLVA